MARITITVAMTVALLLPTAGATTYLVRPDGTGGFPTIQTVVDAAAAGDPILTRMTSTRTTSSAGLQ